MFFRRILATVPLLAQCVLGIPMALANHAPFPDMERSWFRYRDAVSYLQGRDIIQGYPDGLFHPKDPINRAEFLKIVFKGHSTISATRRCFTDVNPDEWYASFICTAQRRGIVDGYPDGNFRPGQTVNTAEAIKIALGAYGRDLQDGAGEHWYAPYVEELDENDILPKDSFLPWETLTRERAADLIARIVRFDEDRILPNLSVGCGKASPTPQYSVTVNGVNREFLLTIPSGYVAHDPTPLIVAFHGRTNSNEQVRSYYKLDREASDYIIAYPSGVPNGNGSYSWSDPGNSPNELRDIALFDAIVELLASQYCVDLDHIYVVGHSLGGWFANSLGCVRGDVIRASASVGSSSVITDCAGPAAAFIAHNPKDTLAAFSGSERTKEMRIEENFCGPETVPTEDAYLNCVQYVSCYGGNVVQWCPHRIDTDERGAFYPHNWPRDTAKHIMRFFESLP